MARIGHGVDALTTAQGLPRGTNTHAGLAGGIGRTSHIAAAAIQRIVHRVDARHSARRLRARAQRIDARITHCAGISAPAAIHGIRFRVDALSIAAHCTARTNALSIHARRRSGTRISAHAAMLVAGHFVDAIGAARVLRGACASAGLAYGQAWAHGTFVNHAIAVVIPAVA